MEMNFKINVGISLENDQIEDLNNADEIDSVIE
jgi:hypothetical protein